ncbi:MAG: hypothetical protein ACI4A8_06475 [Muribaculaceae bacterium]
MPRPEYEIEHHFSTPFLCFKAFSNFTIMADTTQQNRAMHPFSIGRLPQRDCPDSNADRYAYLSTTALEQLIAEKPQPSSTYYLKIVDLDGHNLYLKCRKWPAGDNTILLTDVNLHRLGIANPSQLGRKLMARRTCLFMSLWFNHHKPVRYCFRTAAVAAAAALIFAFYSIYSIA